MGDRVITGRDALVSEKKDDKDKDKQQAKKKKRNTSEAEDSAMQAKGRKRQAGGMTVLDMEQVRRGYFAWSAPLAQHRHEGRHAGAASPLHFVMWRTTFTRD